VFFQCFQRIAPLSQRKKSDRGLRPSFSAHVR
jgi:hypothetical protein